MLERQRPASENYDSSFQKCVDITRADITPRCHTVQLKEKGCACAAWRKYSSWTGSDVAGVSGNEKMSPCVPPRSDHCSTSWYSLPARCSQWNISLAWSAWDVTWWVATVISSSLPLNPPRSFLNISLHDTLGLEPFLQLESLPWLAIVTTPQMSTPFVHQSWFQHCIRPGLKFPQAIIKRFYQTLGEYCVKTCKVFQQQ